MRPRWGEALPDLVAPSDSDSSEDESEDESDDESDSSDSSEDDWSAPGAGVPPRTPVLALVALPVPVTSDCLVAVVAGLSQEEYICVGAHANRLRAAAALLFQGDLVDKRGPHREACAFCWDTHTARLSEAEFKQRYRLSPESFDKLLTILEPKLAVESDRQASNARSGKPIVLQARLAVAPV